MTCLLSSTPWNHYSDRVPWASMSFNMASSCSPSDQTALQGYISPDSEAKTSQVNPGKRRSSRAGTRSVSTLSAAQLERKRANDREAQRAIRQRTKDHIDQLERSIDELRGSKEANDQIVQVTAQRNRELEEENAYLRNRLNEAGVDMNFPLAREQLHIRGNLLPTVSASSMAAPGNTERPRSTSTLASNSGSTTTTATTTTTTTSNAGGHDSWPCPTAGFVGSAATSFPGAAGMINAPKLTAWRTGNNDGRLQTVPARGMEMQDPLQALASTYPGSRLVDWSDAAMPCQPFQTPEQDYHQQTAMQACGSCTTPQSSPTYPLQGTPQHDFHQNIPAASSPSGYPIPNPALFQRPTHFQVAPIPAASNGTGYGSPQGQMQPGSHPQQHLNSTFHHSGQGEHSYGVQPARSAMQFPDNSASRSYSLAHYSTA